MERDSPRDEPPVSPAPDAASAPPRDDGGAARVLDAGTSQELVIINYADDLLLSARAKAREENEAKANAQDVAAESAPTAADESASPAARESDSAPVGSEDASLVIVRDAAFAWDLEQATNRTAVAPPPPLPPKAKAARPPSTAAPAPETVSEVEAVVAADPDRLEISGNAQEASPPWTMKASPGAAPPLPPKPPAAREPSAARQPSATLRPGTVSPERTVRISSGGAEWIDPMAPAKPRRTMAPVASADPGARRMESSTIPVVAARMRARKKRAAREAFAPRAPRRSWVALAAAVAILAGATPLSILGVEPFHTWYYLFAWYPFVIALNHLTAMRSPVHTIFGERARPVAALAAWSIPAWLVFEAFNFRIENWYYVNVPDVWAARRLGILLSFATVLPGLFFLEEAQRVRGAFVRMGTKPFVVTPKLEKNLFLAGLGCAALVLALPMFTFPLVWGVPVLLLEPWLRRRGGPSLLGDLAAGRPDRALRLLVAGLGCGLFWESANFVSGGRWIYTVPGLAHGKVFEMPIPGFLGFAPFALACWTMARTLVRTGLLPDWEVPRPPAPQAAPATNATPASPSAAGPDGEDAPAVDVEHHLTALDGAPKSIETAPSALTHGVRMSLIAWTVLSCGLVLEAMDRLTVDSRTPRPEQVPGIPAGVAEYSRRHGKTDVRGLLALVEEGRMHIPGESSEREVALLRERCRLVLLRGLGTDNARRLDAVGVRTIDDLAAEQPHSLARRLQGAERGWWPRERRVAVWIDAAMDARRSPR